MNMRLKATLLAPINLPIVLVYLALVFSSVLIDLVGTLLSAFGDTTCQIALLLDEKAGEFLQYMTRIMWGK